jgi:hypothetical protein
MYTSGLTPRKSPNKNATPPRWMTERSQAGSQMEVADQGLDETVLDSAAMTNDHNTTYDLTWGAWENVGPIGESMYMNVEWWDMNQF